MEPSSIVVSLEIAEKLKEAGWPQARTFSVFFWYMEYTGESHISDQGDFAAPTVEEILRMLPKDITVDGATYCLEIYFCANDANCIRYTPISSHEPTGGDLADYADASASNAAALMWIYLKENNLLPTKNV